MSYTRCSGKMRKRQRELPQVKSEQDEYPGIESCVPIDDSKTMAMCAMRRLSGAWIAIFLLMLSIQACESFTSTSKSPGILSFCTKSQSTILRVVDAEARTTTEERSVVFQPSIPEHSTVCEQESNEERGEPSEDDFTSESEDQQESTEARAESDDYSESDEESGSEKQARVNAVSRAAALLANRKSRVKENRTAKGTSVGARRVGAASRALSGSSTLSQFTDAVRRSAIASKGQQKKQNDKNNDNLSARLTQSAIHSAVREILSSRQSGQPSMDVLGEASAHHLDLTKIQTTPPPGAVLVDCPKDCRWKASDRVSVRVATEADDLDIANLRLSVFSNFSPNLRHSFCSRSCHVLAMRRNQGATCIVATVPRYGSILSNEKGIVLGTAECSVHEFFGTRLGSRRQQNSILYITEVAVSPTARRKGIGAKIMRSIEELAKIRGVETLYLHVEVTNTQALKLYEKAGFSRLTNDDRMYAEFTRSLGLHDGAMKGRCHFLMYKNVQQPTWISNDSHPTWTSNDMGVSKRGTLGIQVSA